MNSLSGTSPTSMALMTTSRLLIRSFNYMPPKEACHPTSKLVLSSVNGTITHQVTQARSLGVIKFPFPSAPTFTLILLTRKVFNSSMWPQPCSSSGHSCLWFPTTASLQVPCLPSHPHQMYHAHCTDRVIIPKNAEPTALQQTL